MRPTDRETYERRGQRSRAIRPRACSCLSTSTFQFECTGEYSHVYVNVSRIPKIYFYDTSRNVQQYTVALEKVYRSIKTGQHF